MKIINSKKNLGFGGGCNLGAKYAQGEYLVFLNPDSQVAADWLFEGLRGFKNKKVGLVMSKILTQEGQRINSAGGKIHYTGLAWSGDCGKKNRKYSEKPYRVAFASGACLFIRKNLFEKLAGFDQDFFLYYEDTDLSFRAQLLGYQVICCPASQIFHDYQFYKGEYKIYQLVKNRLFFIFKNYSLKMILLFTPAFFLLELSLMGYFLFKGKPLIILQAWYEFGQNWFKNLKKRKKIQKTKKLSDKEILPIFTGRIDFEELKNPLIFVLNLFFVFYWKIIKLFF